MSTLTVWLLLTSLGNGPASGPADMALPADWPPVPDLVHRVDYVQWFADQHRVPPEEDAWPLWRELGAGPDSPLSEREERWLWGAIDKNGWVPGLLTGMKTYEFENYPWDPIDHWDWEEAYQLQQALGFEEKVRAAAERPRISPPAFAASPGPDEPPPAMRLPDNLLLTTLYPSLSTCRAAASILLQNAWRAPRGQIDREALLTAIEAALRIARQMGDEGTNIGTHAALSIRARVHDTVLAVLHHNVLTDLDKSCLRQILAELDSSQVDFAAFQRVEVAVALEMLQLAYTHDEGKPFQPPLINTARLMSVHWYSDESDVCADEEAWLEQISCIHDQDAQGLVQRLIDVHLEMRQIIDSELPFTAEKRAGKRSETFVSDRVNQLVWGRLLQGWLLQIWGGASPTSLAKHEATRRAVHILVALHEVHDRTGAWPRHLRQIKPMLGPHGIEDPFSRREFGYRIENGGPLLYSAARNGRDDGGKHDGSWGWSYEDEDTPTATDYVFWPIQKRTP